MRLVLVSLVLLTASPALSQPVPSETTGRPGRSQDADWVVTVGVAPVFSPAWQGSKDYSLSLFPDLRVNYRDLFFASVSEGVGLNLVNGDEWRAGPIAKLRFGRKEDNGGSPFLIAGGSKALLGMGNIKAAVEVGGFVEKSFGTPGNWRVRADVRRGLGGHGGMLADIAVTYRARLGRTSISFGPRTTLADRTFTRTYFGIDATQASRTGLTPYAPGGGLLSYGLGATIVRARQAKRRDAVFQSGATRCACRGFSACA